jgi:hypothetical protein
MLGGIVNVGKDSKHGIVVIEAQAVQGDLVDFEQRSSMLSWNDVCQSNLIYNALTLRATISFLVGRLVAAATAWISAASQYSSTPLGLPLLCLSTLSVMSEPTMFVMA